MRFLYFITFLISATLFGASTTKVGVGSGTTRAGVGSGTTRVAASGADADVAAWLAAIASNGGTIDGTATAAGTALILGFKADGDWTKIEDGGMVCGDQLAAALTKFKWLSGSATIYTNVGSGFGGGDYSQATGLTGGGTKHLQTDFLASDLTLNSTGFAVYVRSSANATANAHGARTNSTSGMYMYHAYTDDIPYADQYADAEQIGGSVIAGAIGFIHATVTASNAQALYRNGISVGTSASVSGTLPARQMTFFTLNDAAGNTDYSAHTIAFLLVTTGCDSAAALRIYNRIQTFQAALGRDV